MAKRTCQKQVHGSALDFEAQLWFVAALAVPASHCNPGKCWPCASTKSEWFIKDEPQRAEAAENYSISAAIPFSALGRLEPFGKRRKEFGGAESPQRTERAGTSESTWPQPDEVFGESRVSCRSDALTPDEVKIVGSAAK